MTNSWCRIIKAILTSFILLTGGCTNETVDYDEADITGSWSGGFTGNDGTSFSLLLNIESQFSDPDNSSRDLLFGTWSSPNAGIDGRAVTGDITSAHISNNWLSVLLEKTTGTACYYRIRFSGYMKATDTGFSLIDNGATYMHKCITSSGTMELTH